MPRPGVREGVRVGTGQRDRTATPNTLTEERKIDVEEEEEEEEENEEEGEKEEREEESRGAQSMTQPCWNNLYFHNSFTYNFYFGLKGRGLKKEMCGRG